MIHEKGPNLSNHAIPSSINLLAVFAVGDQVEVVSELHFLGDLFQDVNTESFAAAFDVNAWVTCMIAGRWQREEESREKVKTEKQHNISAVMQCDKSAG